MVVDGSVRARTANGDEWEDANPDFGTPPYSLDAALLRAGAPLHRLSKLLHTVPATPQITLFKIVKSRFSQP